MSKQKYPEPTAGALIRNKQGKVLLVRSYKWYGKLTIPGGHVELGETIEQGLKREVKEEVGLNIKVIKLLAVQEFIYGKGFVKKKHFIFFDYLCEAKDTRVKIDNDEIQGYVWVEPRKALRLDVDHFAENVVQAYLKNHAKVLQ